MVVLHARLNALRLIPVVIRLGQFVACCRRQPHFDINGLRVQ